MGAGGDCSRPAGGAVAVVVGTTAVDVARIPAWYAAPIETFLAASDDQVLGRLTAGSHFAVDVAQRGAWQLEIALLREALARVDGWIFLEFEVPRLGSR